MASSNTNTDITICAACGKEGNSSDMNTCNKCKSVKYCNAACKKKHRSKHKKACERRVAELHDEQLFKEVEREECPLCLQILPIENDAVTFESCCGKLICNGCVYAMQMSEKVDLCAFCRTPSASSEEDNIKRAKKLIDKGNGRAYVFLAGVYADGMNRVPQDRQRANELYLKGGERGCADGYTYLAANYDNGWGVERDKKKAKHYYEVAAMMGSVPARRNLGVLEGQAGNHQRATNHFKIAARAGHEESLETVKEYFRHGFVTKDDYASTLRAYQKIQDEMKSDKRDKAARMQDAGLY
jgi:TPR repeat protein